MTSKKQMRATLLAVRDQMPLPVRAKKSASACANAVTDLSQHKTVAVYHAIRSELHPDALVASLRASGATMLYPRVLAHSRVLELCVVRSDSDLTPGTLGILEPKAELPPYPLCDIDALLVPALGFDATGQRLGWGQGHYDHTLAQCPNATRVGICFQEQIVDSVPSEATDVPMHIVITDAKRYEGARNTSAAQREPS
tara:strand:+ start:19447 stop:20040 length:594 start_codon:yes stop_codon:yes gene_type:complete